MFSRAAKSLMKTIGQRKYHAGEENIKLAMIGGAGEIGRTLSQMLKQTSKLDVLALYDVSASNKRFSTPVRLANFSSGESNSRMLTMFEKSRLHKGDYGAESLQGSHAARRATNDAHQNETDSLIESLRRLPIAEEGVARPNTEAQGDIAYARELEGARVLAEMGPTAAYRHGGRIVSEIYRQFPDFAAYLVKNRSSIVYATSTRRGYSNIALFPNDCITGMPDDPPIEKPVPDFVIRPEKAARSRSKIVATAERAERKCHARKRDAKRSTNCATVQEQVLERAQPQAREIEARSKPTQVKCDKRKLRVRKFSEPKALEEIIGRAERRPCAMGKTRNWTIPAVLSDKKPKMLYGLVHQRRRSLTNFFSRFFDVQTNETGEDRHRCARTGAWRYGKQSGAQSQRTWKGLTIRGRACAKPRPEDRLNASTSTTDFDSTSVPLGRSDDSKSAKEIAENPEASEERVLASSNDESETDAVSETSDPPPSASQKISSKIALFLENLRLNSQRSRSLSSLASYNLDVLFDDEPLAPAPTPGRATRDRPFLFASNSDDSKLTLKEKLCRKICGKREKRSEDDVCKKRTSPCKSRVDQGKKCEPAKSCSCQKGKEPSCKKQDSCEKKKCKDSCGGCDGDPCKPFRSEKNHGALCKKYQVDPEYGKKEDPCKKFRKDDVHGKSCKADEDPCKRTRNADVHGRTCNEYRDEFGRHDACEKFWKDDVHGSRCKKMKKPDPCAKSKSCDPCGKKRSDPCKKPDPCKKSDPCKKPDPCAPKKDKGCGTKGKGCSKKCPPVNKAPGCPPKDTGKSGGCCRKYSTIVASRIRARSSFDCRNYRTNVSSVDILTGIPLESKLIYEGLTRRLYRSIFDLSDLAYGDGHRKRS